MRWWARFILGAPGYSTLPAGVVHWLRLPGQHGTHHTWGVFTLGMLGLIKTNSVAKHGSFEWMWSLSFELKMWRGPNHLNEPITETDNKIWSKKNIKLTTVFIRYLFVSRRDYYHCFISLNIKGQIFSTGQNELFWVLDVHARTAVNFRSMFGQCG